MFTRLFAVIDKTCCFTFLHFLINHRDNSVPKVSDQEMSRLDSFLSIVCSYGIDPSQSTILDIGCGNGRFTLELSRVFQKVVTIDSSDTVIQKLLRKMEAENITNISGNNCLNEWRVQYLSDKFQHCIWMRQNYQSLVTTDLMWFCPEIHYILLKIFPSSMMTSDLFCDLMGFSSKSQVHFLIWVSDFRQTDTFWDTL